MTLVEIMIVVIIMAMIATAVGMAVLPQLERARVEQTRTPKFAYFQGPQAQKQIQGLDDAVAYNVNAAGAASRLAPQAELDRRADLYHHPLALVMMATWECVTP